MRMVVQFSSCLIWKGLFFNRILLHLLLFRHILVVSHSLHRILFLYPHLFPAYVPRSVAFFPIPDVSLPLLPPVARG